MKENYFAPHVFIKTKEWLNKLQRAWLHAPLDWSAPLLWPGWQGQHLSKVNHIKTAVQIARWNNDARKLQEMYMILLNHAVVWWRSLPYAGIIRIVWNDVKAEFLAMYEPWYTAKFLNIGFAILESL